MISAYPIGTYSISELGDSAPLAMAGGATVTLVAPIITVITEYRNLTGAAYIGLTSSGTITSTNVISSGSCIINTITNGAISSTNVSSGIVILSLSSSGTITAQNRLNATSTLTLTSVSSLSATVTLMGGAVLTMTSFGSILNLASLGDLVYSTYGINTTTGGHFVYTAYPFTSFFKVDNSYFATSTSGLYKLEGESSTTWVAKSAQTNFGTEKTKNISDVYVDMRNRNDVSFAITTDDYINREGYLIYADDSGGLRRRRVKTHKGLRGNNWQAQISGEGAAEVKQVDCRVSEFKRSIY